MNMQARRSRWLRKLPWIVAAAIMLPLVYFLFEPVFVWGGGWKPLPSFVQAGETFVHPGYEGVAARAHDALAAARDELGAPAISAAVGVDGKLAWSAVLGYADVDARTPATLRSQFRIGSTSKALTSVGIGTLLDRGALDLDAPLGRYAPYLPPEYAALTTRQVMSHTAGVRDYGMCLCFPAWEYYNRRQYDSVRDGLAIFLDDALLFEPGTRFAYTSYGYNLAAAALEGAAQTGFLEYMQREVFAPLGMQGTAADHALRDMPQRAAFYDVEGGRYKPAYPVNNSSKWASGGFIATPGDLVALGNALLADQFLSPATKATLFAPQRLANGDVNAQQYALGWRHHFTWTLFDGKLDAEAIHHQGTANGSTSVFVLFPEYGVTLSLMMNRGVADGGIMGMLRHADAIAETFISACAWQKLPEKLRAAMERQDGCMPAITATP